MREGVNLYKLCFAPLYIGAGDKGTFYVAKSDTTEKFEAFNIDCIYALFDFVASVSQIMYLEHTDYLLKELVKVWEYIWDNESIDCIFPKLDCCKNAHYLPHMDTRVMPNGVEQCINVFRYGDEMKYRHDGTIHFFENPSPLSDDDLIEIIGVTDFKELDLRQNHSFLCMDMLIKSIKEPKVVEKQNKYGRYTAYEQKGVFTSNNTKKTIKVELSNEVAEFDKFEKGQKVRVIASLKKGILYIMAIEVLENDVEDFPYKREPLPLKLRSEVFKRDGYTCQHCGRNPTEDGVKLEIDHILPVSMGGSNDLDNLQTLCYECNRGKSNNFKG